MSTIRRLKKQMSQPVALADTGIDFNGGKVFLASPDPSVSKKAAGGFVGFLKEVVTRAHCVNVQDLYKVHLQVLQKIEAGESLLN